jgi:hypothetical protein
VLVRSRGRSLSSLTGSGNVEALRRRQLSDVPRMKSASRHDRRTQPRQMRRRAPMRSPRRPRPMRLLTYRPPPPRFDGNGRLDPRALTVLVLYGPYEFARGPSSATLAWPIVTRCVVALERSLHLFLETNMQSDGAPDHMPTPSTADMSRPPTGLPVPCARRPA